jgi:DNA-binding transcriptional ArsR family regulator
MIAAANIAQTASLIGDPCRANMLAALFDGRAATAGELALIGGVSPSTASGHLAKLVEGRLVAVSPQGRHRYYRLASADVARVLESLAVAAADAPQRPRATPRVPEALRDARSCYDHLAGRLGVAIADGLEEQGWIVLSADSGEVTDEGRARLARAGVRLPEHPSSRPICRPCMDWSERRPHLAGMLGTAVMDHALELGWVRRGAERRQIVLTGEGRRGFAEAMGVKL